MGKGLEYMFLQRIHKNDQQVYDMMLNITNYQGNINQSHKRYHLTPVRMAIKQQVLTKLWGN